MIPAWQFCCRIGVCFAQTVALEFEQTFSGRKTYPNLRVCWLADQLFAWQRDWLLYRLFRRRSGHCIIRPAILRVGTVRIFLGSFETQSIPHRGNAGCNIDDWSVCGFSDFIAARLCIDLHNGCYSICFTGPWNGSSVADLRNFGCNYDSQFVSVGIGRLCGFCQPAPKVNWFGYRNRQSIAVRIDYCSESVACRLG